MFELKLSKIISVSKLFLVSIFIFLISVSFVQVAGDFPAAVLAAEAAEAGDRK